MAVAERLEPNCGLQSRWEQRRREWAEKLRPRMLPVEDPEKTLQRRMRMILGIMAVYLLLTAQFFFEMFSIAHFAVGIPTLIFVAASLVPLLGGWRYYQIVQTMARDYLREKAAFESEVLEPSVAGMAARDHSLLDQANVREEFSTVVGADEDGITGLQARWKARQREWAERIRPQTLPIEDPAKTFARSKRTGIVLISITTITICILEAANGHFMGPQYTPRYVDVEVRLFGLLPILFTLIWACRSLNAIRKMEQEYLRELEAYERAFLQFPRATENETSLE
jgi:hypothetical protein